MSRALLSCIVGVFFAGAAASAHHTAPGRTHPTVTLTEQLFVGGKPLAAGKYDIYITDERPAVGAGAASEAQRVVQFAQNGKVIATDVAEVFTSGEQPVGTSGAAARGTAQVQKLSGGEFVRIVVSDGGSRYLIHLATSELKQPAPQPQAPARIEITRTPEVVQP
jgi:hypothetical protein